MSEKQVKRQRQEDRQQVDLTAQITFKRDALGGVSAHGHIGNPIAALDILGKGCLALANFYAHQAQENASRIVKPNLQDVKAMGMGRGN